MERKRERGREMERGRERERGKRGSPAQHHYTEVRTSTQSRVPHLLNHKTQSPTPNPEISNST
jgi:hypothetical protein